MGPGQVVNYGHTTGELQSTTESRNKRQYEQRRLETGISKPSIFSGLPSEHTLGLPMMFAMDFMHAPALNLPDLIIPLLRGKFECSKDDNRESWDWAVLVGKKWEEHGKQVADCIKWTPTSFGRAARNPAEKISSGYKAWEFMQYLYGLGPALLFGILPEKYYKNYCKAVRSIRVMVQEEIPQEELIEAHELMSTFSDEFELMYAQRRTDRLHFIRPVIHTLSHYAPETQRMGPGNIYAQWALERTIGNLGREIRQHSNSFANLSQLTLRRSQINALVAILPDLEPTNDPLPRGAIDLGDGYRLLRKTDSCRREVPGCEEKAIREYLEDNFGSEYAERWRGSVVRWARIRLPTRQIARSLWKEEKQAEARVARHVKIVAEDKGVEFAEVLYYCILGPPDNEKHVAVASFFSAPDSHLLDISSKTYWSVQHLRDTDTRVVDIKNVVSVVMMAPDHQYATYRCDGSEQDRWFLMEKIGLKLAYLAGWDDDDDDDMERFVSLVDDLREFLHALSEAAPFKSTSSTLSGYSDDLGLPRLSPDLSHHRNFENEYHFGSPHRTESHYRHGHSLASPKHRHERFARQPFQEQETNTLHSFQNSADIQLQSLRAEVLTLRAENNLLRSTQESLLSIIAKGGGAPRASQINLAQEIDAPLDEANFPKAKFWQKTSWRGHLQNQKGKTDESKSNALDFIEDKKGRPPTDTSAFRNFCYKFFNSLKARGTAPKTWGNTSLEIQEEFRTRAEQAFPDLRLCHGHWKSDQLATIVFPNWHSTHGVKEETDDESMQLCDDDDDVQEVSAPLAIGPKKRSSSWAQSTSKRAKVNPPIAVAPLQSKRVRRNALTGKTPKPSPDLLSSVATAQPRPSAVETANPEQSAGMIAPRPSQPSSIMATQPSPAPALIPDPLPTAPSLPSTDPEPVPREPSLLSPGLNTLPPVPSPILNPGQVVADTLSEATSALLALSTSADSNVLTASSSVVVSTSVIVPPSTTLHPTVSSAPAPLPTVTPVQNNAGPSSSIVSSIIGSSSSAAPSKTSKWNPDKKSITPRGLCAVDYHTRYPAVTDAKVFDMYWKGLSQAEQAPWATRSQQAKEAREKIANEVHCVMIVVFIEITTMATVFNAAIDLEIGTIRWCARLEAKTVGVGRQVARGGERRGEARRGGVRTEVRSGVHCAAGGASSRWGGAERGQAGICDKPGDAGRARREQGKASGRAGRGASRMQPNVILYLEIHFGKTLG
ncbi:hypothetical protein C8R45DRAFT_921782 [Mycena sanguinolenta]|nr:hypothetical protein C8R45DRAFT_921782 [Mycena sanguinolenta]